MEQTNLDHAQNRDFSTSSNSGIDFLALFQTLQSQISEMNQRLHPAVIPPSQASHQQQPTHPQQLNQQQQYHQAINQQHLIQSQVL